MQLQFKRFRPATLVAAVKIQELVQRSGKIVVDCREYVEVKRLQSGTHIDQYGCVEWGTV